MEIMEIFHTQRQWNAEPPRTLVITCSDGRFQEEVDEFLQRHLAIDHYDRLYVPGGAGALVTSETEFIRADRLRTECRFLIEAHGIERVILMVHGPAEDGPAEALCGDYQRRLPTSSQVDIRRQQDRDTERICRDGLGDGVRLEFYRCEVTGDGLVQFVRMHP
ncbi:MAG: hypothetical protein AMS21_03455 [Gemmatimonas sp. SG8_38_2]|nr:MAG: hypothetical protein AMS21_03455 [Gemmatimonas sp. SG8_38_2]